MRQCFLSVLISGLVIACSVPATETVNTSDDSQGLPPTSLDDSVIVEDAITPISLNEAINGDWRSDEARTRDGWRNPQQTLEFFGVEPDGTIIEIWPGAGWYTDILAPWITSHGGQYIPAWSSIDPDNERAAAFQDRFITKFEAPHYGPLSLVEFGRASDLGAIKNSADAVLTFRNVHNWMSGDYAEKIFGNFFVVLKPGGVLGLVEHRLPADSLQDPRASSGYVQQDYVIALAKEAGFEFVFESDINANLADTTDHPFGVWTLPPVRRSAPRGQSVNPDFDHSAYDLIGESDRMTLLFRKPVTNEAGNED